jgi:hypothetical protein
VAVLILAYASLARGQEPANPNARPVERQTVGTVTQAGRGSILVETDEGKVVIFALNPSVHIPKLAAGSRVRVITATSDTDPAPIALAIDALPPREGLAEPQAQPVPADMRRIASELERQAKRYRIGFTLGMALDPEMVSVSGFGTFSPFSQRSFALRPGLEVAFGEVTSLLALHLDVLYGLPGFSRSNKWAPYIGGGPNFTFSHRGVETGEFINEDEVLNGGNNNGNNNNGNTSEDDSEDSDNGRFDFSQFDWNTGFNFIIGAKTPNGAFFEMKATAWGVASVRMLGGLAF